MATLQKGSQGADVQTLQQDLAALGYTISVDGIFGNATLAVVIRFQQDNDLSADGIVGPNTWAVITDLLAAPCIMGIDVSHFDGLINWNLVPKNQVSFVYCKASQGQTYRDPMMATNMSELARLGYIRGVYHFLTFMGVPAADQVNNFLGAGIDFKQPGLLPPVVDIEWQQSDSLNQYIINNQAACIQLIQDWLNGVQSATGRVPVIYTNTNFWQQYLGNPAGFGAYPLWLADYESKAAPPLPAGWGNYTIWQNSDAGTVAGIDSNVDKNIFNGAMADLNTFAGM